MQYATFPFMKPLENTVLDDMQLEGTMDYMVEA